MGLLNLSWRELHERNIAKCRDQVGFDYLRIPLVSLWRDLGPNRVEPVDEPCPDRHAIGVNVFAGVHGPKQSGQLAFGIFAGAPHCCCRDPALAGDRIAAEVIAQAEASRRTRLNVTPTT